MHHVSILHNYSKLSCLAAIGENRQSDLGSQRVLKDNSTKLKGRALIALSSRSDHEHAGIKNIILKHKSPFSKVDLVSA